MAASSAGTCQSALPDYLFEPLKQTLKITGMFVLKRNMPCKFSRDVRDRQTPQLACH